MNTKINSLVLSIAIALVCTSCGASKGTTINYQSQHQSVQQRPNRTMRTLEPCISLAQEDSECWRAYGTATSYVEKNAINEAHRDARNQLAQMMKVAIEGAAQDYAMNAQKDLKGTAETIGESVMTQYVTAEISNTRTIKTSIYDLSDGSIQVYVCIEMRKKKEEFNNELDNTLSRDGIIGIQFDRDRFIKKMSSNLEDYKKKNNE